MKVKVKVKVARKMLTEADEVSSAQTALTADNLTDFFNKKVEVLSGYTPKSINETINKLNDIVSSEDKELVDQNNGKTIEELSDDELNRIPKAIEDVITNYVNKKVDNNWYVTQIRSAESEAIAQDIIKGLSTDNLDTIKGYAADLLALVREKCRGLKSTELDNLYKSVEELTQQTTGSTSVNSPIKNPVKVLDDVIATAKDVANQIRQAAEDRKNSQTNNTEANSATVDPKQALLDNLNEFNNNGNSELIEDIIDKINTFVSAINDKNKGAITSIIQSQAISGKVNIFSSTGGKNIIDNPPVNIILAKEAGEITNKDLTSFNQTISTLNEDGTTTALEKIANDNTLNQVISLANKASAAAEAKPKRDWKALLIDAAKNGTADVVVTENGNTYTKKLDTEGIWDLYYVEEWDNKVGPGTGNKVKNLGSSFVDEVFALGFNSTTNPFISFLQIAFGPDYNLIIPALNYSAVHNAVIDHNLVNKDLRATNDSMLGLNNLIFKQALYNVAARDDEEFLDYQLKCYTNLAEGRFTDDLLKNNYSTKNASDFINAVFFIGGDPLTLKAPDNTEVLKPITEIEAIIGRCFDIDLKNTKANFSIDNKEIQDLIDANGNTKENAIDLIKYIIATNNYTDKADDILKQYGINDPTIDLTSANSKRFSKALKNNAIKLGAIATTIGSIAKYAGLI